MKEQRPKINSRKKDCPVCWVKSGSRHNKNCQYAYKLPEDSKELKVKRNVSLWHRLAHLIGAWNGYCDAFYVKEHLYMAFVCEVCGRKAGAHCIDGLIQRIETPKEDNGKSV